MSLLSQGSLCVSMHVSLSSDEGENGIERKGAKAVPGCPPISVSHMEETVTGNSLIQQLQGEMIKEWRNANQKSRPLSFHTSHNLLFTLSLNSKKKTTIQSTQPFGTVILQKSRDIYQSPYKKELINIKSFVTEEFFPDSLAQRQFWLSKISRNAAIINQFMWRH